MHVEYRKKHPYYGKYKLKVSIYNRAWKTVDEVSNQEQVKRYLTTNYVSFDDFKWYSGWNVYIKNEDIFNDLNAAFPDYICYVHRPAPGYENLEGVEENNKRVLWYEKYPYKVVLSVNRHTYYDQIAWCKDNIKGDVKTSTGQVSTSFYFMNSFDTMAFKLAFSDFVIKTVVANSEKSAILLKERMDTATSEYHEYLEGESDDKQKK